MKERKPPDPSTLAGRIELARSRAGLTQDALGQRAGVKGGTIWRYENGQLQPSIIPLAAIARACGVRMEWLVTGEEPSERADVEPVPAVAAAE